MIQADGDHDKTLMWSKQMATMINFRESKIDFSINISLP